MGKEIVALTGGSHDEGWQVCHKVGVSDRVRLFPRGKEMGDL